MEDLLYPGTLLILAIVTFTFYQNHNVKLAMLSLALIVYVVYSHETGHTATDFKNEMIQSVGEGAENFVKSNNAEAVK